MTLRTRPLVARLIPSNLSRGSANMRMTEAVKRFLEQSHATLAPKTIDAYDDDLRRFVAWALASVEDSVLVFNADLVEDYLVTCSKRLSLRTVARRRAVLASFA